MGETSRMVQLKNGVALTEYKKEMNTLLRSEQLTTHGITMQQKFEHRQFQRKLWVTKLHLARLKGDQDGAAELRQQLRGHSIQAEEDLELTLRQLRVQCRAKTAGPGGRTKSVAATAVTPAPEQREAKAESSEEESEDECEGSDEDEKKVGTTKIRPKTGVSVIPEQKKRSKRPHTSNIFSDVKEQTKLEEHMIWLKNQDFDRKVNGFITKLSGQDEDGATPETATLTNRVLSADARQRSLIRSRLGSYAGGATPLADQRRQMGDIQCRNLTMPKLYWPQAGF